MEEKLSPSEIIEKINEYKEDQIKATQVADINPGYYDWYMNNRQRHIDFLEKGAR